MWTYVDSVIELSSRTRITDVLNKYKHEVHQEHLDVLSSEQ